MADKINGEKLWYLTKFALSLAMGLAYVAIGILVIIKKWFMIFIDSNVSYILGSLLILYGMYRSYRIVKSLF